MVESPTKAGNFKKVERYYFDTSAPIGKGAFGTVYIAYDEADPNVKLAVKAIPSSILLNDLRLQEQILREIQILKQLKGDHIVGLVDVLRTKNSIYILMDFCDGGDLETKLQKNGNKLSEDEACSIVKQIASAFVTINKEEITNSQGKKISLMHRDIKPTNILFNKDKVKLADFGFAKTVEDADADIADSHTLLGTPFYSSPQILNFENYNTKCDIWSTGILLYQIIFGGVPWPAKTKKQLYTNITSQPLNFPNEIKSSTKDLIKGMLELDEEKRLTWQQVYSHPALAHIKI